MNSTFKIQSSAPMGESRQKNDQNSAASRLNLDQWLVFSLFATLPLFSLRALTNGVSITLVILILITLRGIYLLVFKSGSIWSRDLLDVLLLAYLGLAGLSSLGATNEYAYVALLKSFVYLCTYFGLRMQFNYIGKANLYSYTLLGCKCALVLYVLLVLVAIVKSGVGLSIADGFSYWNFTYKIFSALDSVYTLKSSSLSGFENKLAMRNSIGEIFALITLLLVIDYQRGSRMTVVFLIASVAIVLLTFSRRSILEICCGYAIISYVSISRYSATQNFMKFAMVAFAVLTVAFIAPEYENRFEQIRDESRFAQYADAIRYASDRWVFGYGYGEKLAGEKYVHNFVVASAFMLGILGFFVSLSIYCLLLVKLYSFSVSSKSLTSCLLVIPLVGLMVSSTVEGIFTPAAWISLAWVATIVRERSPDSLQRAGWARKLAT